MSRVISSFLVLSPMMLSAIVVTNEYVMYNHNTGSIIEPGHTAVCNLITNNVAPWALAGHTEPQGMTTNAVKDIVEGYGYETATNAAAVYQVKGDYATKAYVNTVSNGAVVTAANAAAADAARKYLPLTGGDVLPLNKMWKDVNGNSVFGNEGPWFWYGKTLWSQVYGTPETLAEYGITNAYTKSEADGRYLQLSGGTVTGEFACEGLMTAVSGLYIVDDYGLKIYSSENDYQFKGYEFNHGNETLMLPWIGGASYIKSIATTDDIPTDIVHQSTVGGIAYTNAAQILSSAENTAGTIASNLVDHTNVRFSNEVLAVGLGIGTNEVAQINAILNEMGETPISEATTIGALLAALAAAVAWLKKKSVKKDSNGYYFED